MAQCHELVALSSLYLIKNRIPFQTNDAEKIKIELHKQKTFVKKYMIIGLNKTRKSMLNSKLN